VGTEYAPHSLLSSSLIGHLAAIIVRILGTRIIPLRARLSWNEYKTFEAFASGGAGDIYWTARNILANG
jgi:hypothetical protein